MVVFSYIAAALFLAACSFAAPTAAPDVDAPDFELTTKGLVRRQGYSQNYKTTGDVNFTPNKNGYSVKFSNAGYFVVGKGWTTGTTRYDNHGGTV